LLTLLRILQGKYWFWVIKAFYLRVLPKMCEFFLHLGWIPGYQLPEPGRHRDKNYYGNKVKKRKSNMISKG